MRIAFILLSMVFAAPLVADNSDRLPSERHALQPPTALLELPAMDAAKQHQTALAAQKPGEPLRFAESLAGKALRAVAGKALAGEWQDLPDGSQLWRLAVHAPGAMNLNFHFSKFRLPYGAELHIVAPDLKQRLGPYSDADNQDHREFWTPLIDGERAVIELLVPAGAEPFLEFELGGIQRGFVDPFGADLAKAGTCNIDVLCPEGDDWRDEIRSAASYSIGGSGLCSGTLMATSGSNDGRTFTTANHCINQASAAASTVFYWKHQHPLCRAVGSAANGTFTFGSSNPNAVTQTGGATLLGNHPASDFTVLRLNNAVPTAAQAFQSGWDRRSTPALGGGTGIHHPRGHEKRISFTQQTLVRDDAPADGLGNFHWRVPFWDDGTTEPGSSGSGLWSIDKRLIGVLSGGSASCGNPSGFDIYGRLETAWNGGGSPGTRARDHLDPAGSGVDFLDGGGGCSPPTVTLDVLTANPAAGQAIVLRANASGGSGGPYSYRWDVDGDGQFERESSSNEIAPLYPRATSTQVRVMVSDSAGCSALATRALDVIGADLVVTPGTPSQLCGNNNAALDPGERWRLPVTVRNDGGKSLSQAALLFQALGVSGAPGGPDAFGYSFADQNDGGACGFGFVDISDGQRLAVTPSSSFDAEDDGRSNPITLQFPFNFYGQSVSSLVMSTNGYLSTSTAEPGGQWAVNCSGEQTQGSTGARIDPLQYDWLYDPAGGPTRGLFHRHFANCPRPPDVGPANLACHVFQWNGMESFTDTPAGTHDFQAILYAQTHQIAFQYRTSNPTQGNGAHVTIQNANNSTRLPYACQQSGVIGPVQSVCYFHPASSLAESAPTVRLENAALGFTSLGPGQQQTLNLDFQVEPDASCGAPARIRFLGGGEAGSFSTLRAGTVFDGSIAGSCQTVSNCPAQIAQITPQQGLYANPARFGNGFGSFLIPLQGQEPVYFGAWFTALADRTPTWYILQGPLRDNQVTAPVLRFRQTGSTPFAVSSEVIGEAHVVFSAPNRQWVWWSLPEGSGLEPVDILYPGTRPQGHHTQAWFHPPQSGWGLVFDEHILGGTPDLVAIAYLYGANGTARWSLGSTTNIATGAMAQSTFRVHCPGCPSFADFGSFPLPAGSLLRNFSGTSSGTAQPEVTWPVGIGGNFIRTQPLPIQPLAPPQ